MKCYNIKALDTNVPKRWRLRKSSQVSKNLSQCILLSTLYRPRDMQMHGSIPVHGICQCFHWMFKDLDSIGQKV